LPYGGSTPNGSILMIFLTWISSFFATKKRQSAQRSRRTLAVERLADTLFYKPAGVAGTLGRLGLLALVAVISYFAGAGLGVVVMKVPVPIALFIGAVFVAWMNSDADTG